MSVEEKNFLYEKEEKYSSPHFLSQLKDIIHGPNENINKKDQINNKDIVECCENNFEQKEDNTNTTINSSGANNNIINNDINIDKSDRHNLDSNMNINDIDIINQKELEKSNEKFIENYDKDNNSNNKNN